MNFNEALPIKTDYKFEEELQNHQPIYDLASIDELERLDTYLRQFKATVQW